MLYLWLLACPLSLVLFSNLSFFFFLGTFSDFFEAFVNQLGSHYLEIDAMGDYEDVLEQYIGVPHLNNTSEVLEEVFAAVKSVALPQVLHQLVLEELQADAFRVLSKDGTEGGDETWQVCLHCRQIRKGLSQVSGGHWQGQNNKSVLVQRVLNDVRWCLDVQQEASALVLNRCQSRAVEVAVELVDAYGLD